MRRFAARLALGCGALALTFLGLEAGLRLLPVQDGPNAALEQTDPDVWFEPDREFTYSRGGRMLRANELQTNNLGFVSAIDYDENDPRPLVAVIGDSYVEALMIPEEKTLTARLRRQLGPNRRVYSFAASGAPLSQYLHFADVARRRFRPESLVILVVGNDFDESLQQVKWAPGFHHFIEDTDGALALTQRPLPSHRLHALLRRSALVNYLFRNLELRALPRRLRRMLGAGEHHVGNTRVDANPARIEASNRVIDAFLAELPQRAGLPAERIVLVVDGLRTALYEPERAEALSDSYFATMRRNLIERAQRAGHPALDMHPVFAEHYARNGGRFEFPDDGHWNALAHGIAAETLVSTGWLGDELPPAETPDTLH